MTDPRQGRKGRLRGAWEVIMGRSLTPRQIEAEWLDYKMMFDDILSRLSTQLARQAKGERKRLRAQLDLVDGGLLPPAQGLKTPFEKKQELRAKAAAMKGIRHPFNGRSQVDVFSQPEEAP